MAQIVGVYAVPHTPSFGLGGVHANEVTLVTGAGFAAVGAVVSSLRMVGGSEREAAAD